MRILYQCVTCGATVESEGVIYQCPRCADGANPRAAGAAAHTAAGGRGDTRPGVPAAPLQGFPRGGLSVVFTPGARGAPGPAADPHSFLPVPVPRWQAFPAGGTPMAQPEALRQSSGFSRLFLKLDSLNPSGSLKDRASLLVAEQARLLGETRVALASTGNAGASMACAGAACGLSIVLFVPAAAPRAKLLQSLVFGARVVPVKGTYDEAFALSIDYTKELGGINRNTGYNPLTVEGKKTVSIEVYNQLGGRVPDVLYVPVGDGVIFSGACKGFADLMKAGYTERMPTLVAVQAEGSNAIAQTWRTGRETVLTGSATIADSLSVSCPASGIMAVECLRRYGGRAVEVSDAEIRGAQAELGKSAGVFVEPSSAAAWAGFLKDRSTVDSRSTVVVLLTGTGFKDTAAAERLVTMPAPCAPTLEGALRLLADTYGMKSPGD